MCCRRPVLTVSVPCMCSDVRTQDMSSRPKVSTPLTSLRRLAEGYWLKQSSMSPYADFVTAMLIRSTGLNLQKAYSQRLKSLGLVGLLENSEILSSGDMATLVYLWNPFTIVSCVGLSTSPIENLVIILSRYGACTRQIPLAAFGWVIATHLSLYPAILIVLVFLLLGYGPDAPPRKLLLQRNSCELTGQQKELKNQPVQLICFSWKPVVCFFLWASMWAFYVLVLCGISVKQYGGLREMFKRTYGFILTVEDLCPSLSSC
ncbi:phosphatidylinositol glycan anchor biosynthesis class U protein-like [Camellia sinensis]|uniref:phosphatidylinositol glycan anchor biosynthesis class U protein-like n=1 Tax=Camellia sinensis TaxID=4442 RepID=UPI0010355C26|nr:phosphatidylinositol glycan anchor biosynthesis class U protein-like [Camellia sinensis]